ncbi:MAG: DoxX family membrane protein [Gammaproteobacteria bacterium]|nr:DoxX family membrane protein [Gammaproteobacteria bacterium]NND37663.1 DoxX family membrane protein [Gammaproteobacteria bacterium]
MTRSLDRYANIWTWDWIRHNPLRSFGIVIQLLLRTLFSIFWLAAGVNKVRKDWLTTDILKEIFLDRLKEMPPDAFAVFYLQTFAIPLYKLVAWVVTFGELYAALGLLLGLTTRWAAWVSLFILVNLAIGGYYDASLLPFFILNIVFLCWSSGLWFGLDRILARRHPDSRWFQ